MNALKRKLYLSWIKGIQRSFSSSNGKKSIHQLMKKVHPDMFNQASTSIKQQNLNSVQSINEFWDTFEVLERSVESSLTKYMEISKPFKVNYNFTSYIHAQESDQTTLVKFVLQPPEQLTKLQTLPVSSAAKALDSLLKDFGMLFTAAGIENPWPQVHPAKPPSETPSSQRSQSELLKELDQKLYERALAKQKRVFSTSAFQVSPGANKKSILRGEADAFIQSGNVMVKGMSTIEEFEALKLLRNFFLDYGDVINFNCSMWMSVLIVLQKPEMKLTMPGRASAEPAVKKGSEYQCEIIRDHFVLRIPPNFKAKRLLALLNSHVPVARRFM